MTICVIVYHKLTYIDGLEKLALKLEGKTADGRSDIFAFGALLHEMLTGQKAFTGKSQANLISSILRAAPPPASSLRNSLPLSLDRFLMKCMEKDPEDRWQSARDLVTELHWIERSIKREPPAAKRERFRMTTVGALVAGLALGLGVATLWFRPAPPKSNATRLTVQLPEGYNVTRAGNMPLAISPDGRRLAFTASSRQGGDRQLFVRELDRFETRPLPGTTGASFPFFSPDGGSIGFYSLSDRTLKKILLTSGKVTTICEYSDFFHGGY